MQHSTAADGTMLRQTALPSVMHLASGTPCPLPLQAGSPAVTGATGAGLLARRSDETREQAAAAIRAVNQR